MIKPRLALVSGIIFSFFAVTMIPSAFADVISLDTQKTTYEKGEKIVFFGMATEGQENISVVVRDSSGEFVTLRSIASNLHGFFQTIPIDSDDIFTQNGIYEATAFSNDQPEHEGKTITLRYSNPIISSISNFNKIFVSTNSPSYFKGETIHIFGQSPVSQIGVPLSIVTKDFRGVVIDSADIYPEADGTFSYFVSTVGSQWHFTGVYTINAQQFHLDSGTSFVFRSLNPPPILGSPDNVKPIVLVPETISAKISGTEYARVSYSVTAIDDKDGIIVPKCTHPQSSIFPEGQTRVTCIATDSSGNSSSESFLIIVTQKNIVIPTWVRNVTGDWCSNALDDKNYSEALEYWIKNDVMEFPQSKIVQVSSAKHIPTWVKEITCWWSEGMISDKEFVSGMEYLISKGIVKV